MEPKQFTGLHSHSCVGSIGDAIGFPQEHIDFALSNGADSLALTDHGTMSGISHQQIKQAVLTKAGVKFKTIPGIEAYFIDSLSDWRVLQADSKAKLVESKANKAKRSEIDLIGNELASTEDELAEIKPSSDDEAGTAVENEAESKSKQFNPLNQRNHLVLLPKSNQGLKNLFRMVSESYIDGFYKYPRIDFDMLRRHAKGEVIGISACIAGRAAKVVFDNVADIHTVSTENFELIQKLLKEKAEQFIEVLGPENYYLELQFNKLGAQHLVNMHLIELAKRTGIKLVATADSHYSNPAHWKEREIYKAMAWATKTKGTVDPNTLPKKIEELKCELYPKNASQMWKAYKETCTHDFYNDQVVLEAIERTHEIAHQQIGSVSIDNKVKLPALSMLVSKERVEQIKEKIGQDTSEDDVAYRELVTLAVAGLKQKGKANDDTYIARLKKELEDIKYLQENSKFRFAKYFLTYKTIMDVTSGTLLTGNGRGSVSGSLLAYVLGISQVDPIRFGTLWERMLSRNKRGAPDIDNDWSDRDQAVKLLIQHFGVENVIPVSNFAQLQLRSLIKDVARLYSLPFEEINSATSKIEIEVLSQKKKEAGFDRGTWVLTYDEADEHSSTFRGLMKKYPEFEGTINVLFKQMRNISRHAGGVIITENSREGMPLIKSGGELQTPWAEGVNYRHLEEFGLLKFDILGLGTLRMFEQCVRKILVKEGNKNPTFLEVKKWFFDKLHPDNNPMDDLDVYKHVFWNGNYAGTFQFISENVQKFMAEMKPRSILDIAIATSIYRPGPLSLKVDRKFLENRANPEDVVYAHPLLKEVFAETSGLLIFQEQLQLIYHKLAGVPLDETDGVRKAFTKKDISNKEKAVKDREDLKKTFISLCKTTNNIQEKVSSSLFDEMQQLVAYSFNRSHGVSYALTTYQCAWLLKYYPDEWITTYIDYCATEKGKISGKDDPKAVAIKEAQRLGYTVGKADINTSEYEYTMHPTDKKTLVPSFGSMKHVGKTVMQELSQFRPYKSLNDLLINSDGTWRHSKLNKRALSTLIKLEALDSLGLVGKGKTFDNYKQMHAVVIDGYDNLKRISSKKKNNDISLVLKEETAKVKLSCREDWSREEKLELQKELAGSVDFDLLMPQEIQNKLGKLGFSSIDYWDEDEMEGQYWAIVSGVTVATTKTGKQYLKIKLFAESIKESTCFVWNYKPSSVNIQTNDIVVGVFKKTDFGLTAWQNKIFKVTE